MLQLFSMVLLLLLSCKPFATVKNIAKHETLFDKLIARAPQQQVPYPFAALLSYLSQYGKPVGVLVPLGRSLQRQAASFIDPRRIVGFAAFDENKSSELLSVAEFELSGRLFLGYVENTKQIEVMSLLPDRDVFDFQTVENYGMPSMQVQAHAFAACRSCHQHGGPIFTPFAWEETNSAQLIAFLLQRHHPQGEVDTIPVQSEQQATDGEASSRPVVSLAREFEDTVIHAANIINDYRLWKMCAEATCRAYLLRKTFASINLALPPPVEVNTPSLTPPAPIIEDRFIVSGADLNIFQTLSDSSKQTLSDYTLSPAAQAIVTKIKNTPQNFRELKEDEFLREQLISVFIGAAKIIRGEEIPFVHPSLSPTELETVYAELEQLLTHVHRKDLHLRSSLDPQQTRQTFDPIVMLNTILGRETDKIFRQQLLLPANKNLKTKSGNLEKIELLFSQQDFGEQASLALFWQASFFSEPWQRNIRGNCKQHQCVFKNFSIQGTSFIEGHFNEMTARVQEFLFNTSKVKGARPPISKLTISMDGKTYRYQLLCHKTELEFGDKGYLCSVHDMWKLTTAIDKLSKNKASPLHHSVFNAVAVIKALLAELSYDLKTNAGKIDWRKTHRNETVYTHDSLLHRDVRKDLTKHSSGASLLKRCGGCHDSHAVPVPFLVADTVAQLCSNITAARDVIIDRIDNNTGIGNMPPAHTSQSENFSDKERQALLTTLQADKPVFCP